MNRRGRIVFMGTPQFAVAPLRRLIEEGFDIAAVVTVPDKPSGRGLVPTPSDVKIYADSCSIPVLQPVSLKDPQFLEGLNAFKANLFIVVAFRMLPKEVWSIPTLGTFNLHASLLPDYRGAAPINWALINGETKTGVTTFLIDEKIDTGAILFREECNIYEEDNAEALHDRLMNMGGELVVKTASALLGGEIEAVAQSEKEKPVIHSAPKLTKETGRIDWHRNPREIHNLVRGLSPYPTAHSILTNGEKEFALKIFSTRYVLFDSNIEYGEITGITKNSFHVACKGGSVEILEVQLPGKKRVTTREFLSGFRNPESFKFI
ncbi:MAG: methionyl-tRNA formyltransferase [Bacteroidales bacterium]|nr:methionyl-tRNA formyltransferase [Bacteroidales bacterium]MDD4491836.1 methionyl-tRNA formyltransferase [Bacteroidales bacterium]HNW49153.1 methionyl-tRNA formyltransferase [Bacteroidales bacterium]HPS95418.1 methionyl-tRNA formyltransferase [Bacteroidales bacterium]